MRLLITRPREDAENLAEALAARGHETVIEPLLEIRYLAMAEADRARLLDGVQAVLVTSANGLRAFALVSDRRDVAVLAVGDASARAAVKAGFAGVESAGGDVVALARMVIETRRPEDGALLHAAAGKVAGDLSGMLQKAGFEVRRAVLYEAHKAGHLSAAASAGIAAGKFHGVLLFSPRTAESFVSLIAAAGLTGRCRKITAYCLSEAVAEKLRGLEWAAVAVAARPDQPSLIETVGP